MAINNWRYVVTWGYMDPQGRIVEETQYVPGTTSDTFSPAEAFRLQADWYANLWDNVMSKIYGDLANNLWSYSTYANSTLWAYDKLLNFMAWNEGKLQSVAWTLYNDLVGDINNQRSYVNQMFGPDGELTKEINSYYWDLSNYLSTEAGREAAKIAAQWVHSWASLWAIRAQQNEAYNQAFSRYVQAKEQQINAKQQIASNLINFMSTLRREYWDTTNQYIIEMYKRAYDLYNNVALSVAQDLDYYNKLRFSGSWSSSWSSYSDLLKALWVDLDDTSSDAASWISKSNEQAIKDAQSKLWLTVNGGTQNNAKARIRAQNQRVQQSNASPLVKTLWNIWVAGTYILPNSFYELLWF